MHVDWPYEFPGAYWIDHEEEEALVDVYYNIPRAVRHAVTRGEDVPAIRHLYAPPDDAGRAWFAERMKQVRPFARENGLFVQAWTAFGMDAAVWFMGTEGAVMMAIDAPEAFGQLMETILAWIHAQGIGHHWMAAGSHIAATIHTWAERFAGPGLRVCPGP